MLVSKTHWLVAIAAAGFVAGPAVAQQDRVPTTKPGTQSDAQPSGEQPPVEAAAEGSGDADAAVDPNALEPDKLEQQMRMDQMAMKQTMKNIELVSKVKSELMSDERLAARVAREILMQELVQDKEYLAMMRDGLRTETDSDPAMESLVEKISAAKAAMVKDEAAMMSMTRELMVRQLAANRIAMMNGGRLNEQAPENVSERTEADSDAGQISSSEAETEATAAVN
ncbi:hypothetical protein [Allorhodopirellula solitaria]|uniref:Periplasmic protein n=1 Tax=Allorhodopirellula solitaria TaxID=2527987 RepID=A0A5C5YEA8_9BACT|nr:hypothetical protein [Allorhodopirellula solitaria]TWT74076.1 hypothetical protein CA85_09620 [Allorhodopirellula solitaria]